MDIESFTLDITSLIVIKFNLIFVATRVSPKYIYIHYIIIDNIQLELTSPLFTLHLHVAYDSKYSHTKNAKCQKKCQMSLLKSVRQFGGDCN